MTRLLKTAIIARCAKTVVSSWIDMLAGLSSVESFRTPPCFCAHAGSAANSAASSATVAGSGCRFRVISRLPPFEIWHRLASFGPWRQRRPGLVARLQAAVLIGAAGRAAYVERDVNSVGASSAGSARSV